MDDNSPNLVELARFLDRGAAYIARSILEAHEIDCFIFDDNAATLGVGNTAVPIRLMVSSDDIEPAQNALAKDMNPS